MTSYGKTFSDHQGKIQLKLLVRELFTEDVGLVLKDKMKGQGDL